jgi:hypothetical protein
MKIMWMLPLVVGLGLLASPVLGEDRNPVSWPQFRGPADEALVVWEMRRFLLEE